MFNVQQIWNRVFRQGDDTLATKPQPPTGWKCVADTVTSATPNEATEFGFGLADGDVSEAVTIINDGASAILVSLDGGETYGSVGAGASYVWDVARASVHVKSAAASQAFTLWVGGAF